MKKLLRGLVVGATIALSLFASTTDAFAKDARLGRETAWTDREPLPWSEEVGEIFFFDGVTWE